jgi:hypothetical protein
MLAGLNPIKQELLLALLSIVSSVELAKTCSKIQVYTANLGMWKCYVFVTVV